MASASPAVQATLLLLGLLNIGQAQVELERFFPPAVARGTTTSIKADGKFPDWPLEIECDQADVVIECDEKAGEFKVTPSPTAVGAAWIRLHDPQSASSLVPLLIESTALTLETEPNETLAKAATISLPATIVGKLEKNGDVDMWKLSLQEGEQLVASVTAHTLLNSPMDAVLQLVDARGLVIAQAEDNNGLDPQMIYTAKRAGDFYLRLFCFPETPTGTIGFAGGANFVYMLRMTIAPFLDHVQPSRSLVENTTQPRAFGWSLPDAVKLEIRAATEIAPAILHSPQATGWQWLPQMRPGRWSVGFDEQNSAPETALEPPVLFYGRIGQAKEIDRIRLKVKAGVSYRAEIVSRELGFKLDSVLRVLKSDSTTPIARNDDSGRGSFDAVVDFKTEKDEELVIEVSDLADSGSLRHAYELIVAESLATANLTVAADHFRIAIGKSVEIPISIERQSAYAQRLEIAAKNLPPGITAEKVISEPKGDSSKSVKLKLTAAADAGLYQGSIEFISTPVDDQNNPLPGSLPGPHANQLPIKFTLRPQIDLTNLWLTVATDKP